MPCQRHGFGDWGGGVVSPIVSGRLGERRCWRLAGCGRCAVAGDPVVARQLQVVLRAAAIPNWLRDLLAPLLRGLGQSQLAHLLQATRARSGHDYFGLLAGRAALRQRWFDGLHTAGIDVVLCPPHALPAMRHGATEWTTAAACYAFVANLLGAPAGVVPVTTVRADEAEPRLAGRDRVLREAAATESGSAGLPVGVQVIGRLFREDQALAAMQVLETALGDRPDWPLRWGPRMAAEPAATFGGHARGGPGR